MRRFLALLGARNKEFYRDRQTLAWNFAFPFLIVFGFAFLFTGQDQHVFKVAIVGDPEAAGLALTEVEGIQFVEVVEAGPAVEKVRRHGFDLVVDPAAGAYWVNTEGRNGALVERILWASDGRQTLERREVTGRPIRYVDWLVPGLIALNLMFSCLFGVGYVIVRYRKNGVLRRLKATPLPAIEFLGAQVGSRWLIVMTTSAIIYIGSDLAIDLPLAGRILDLIVVFGLGAACHISLGLLISARTSSEELAGGLLNLVSWPMMLLGEVWFSLEGTPEWVQRAALFLPLNRLVAAARAILIDGAGLADLWPHLAVLAGLSIVFLGLGAASFRWE